MPAIRSQTSVPFERKYKIRRLNLVIVAITFALLSVMIVGCAKPTPAPTLAPEPKHVEFLITSLIITPPIVVTGSVATVEAEIRNLDAAEGIAEVIMKIDGGETQTKEVILEGSGTQTVSFDIVKDSAGKYEIEISGVNRTLTVVQLDTYENPQYGYSVSYPAKWEVNDDDLTLVKIQSLERPIILVLSINELANPSVLGKKALEELYTKAFTTAGMVFIKGQWVRPNEEILVYEMYFTQMLGGEKRTVRMLSMISGKLLLNPAFSIPEGDIWDDWQSVVDTVLKSFNPPSPDFVPPPSPAP